MDNPAPIKKRRHVRPSLKQTRALQLISQGYSKRRAMIEAGYSMYYAKSVGPKRLMQSRAVQGVIETMKAEMVNSDLTPQYMVGKIKRWMEAQKDDKEDFKTQQSAYKFWKDIMSEKKEDNNLKKRITFEEFIGEDKKDETKI